MTDVVHIRRFARTHRLAAAFGAGVSVIARVFAEPNTTAMRSVAEGEIRNAHGANMSNLNHQAAILHSWQAQVCMCAGGRPLVVSRLLSTCSTRVHLLTPTAEPYPLKSPSTPSFSPCLAPTECLCVRRPRDLG